MSGITARRRASSRRGGRRARSPRAGAGARRRDGVETAASYDGGGRSSRARGSFDAGVLAALPESSSPAPSPRRRLFAALAAELAAAFDAAAAVWPPRRGRFRLGEHGHPGAASRGVRRPRENRGTLLCFGGMMMRNQIPTTTTTLRFQTRASVFVVARRPVRSAPRGRGVARAHDRYFARDDGLDRRRAGGRSAVVRGRGRGRGVRARSRLAVQGAAGEKDPRGPLRGGPAAVPPRRPGRLHGPLRRRSPGGRASRSRTSPVPSSRGISRPPPRPPPRRRPRAAPPTASRGGCPLSASPIAALAPRPRAR